MQLGQTSVAFKLLGQIIKTIVVRRNVVRTNVTRENVVRLNVVKTNVIGENFVWCYVVRTNLKHWHL